MTRQPCRCGGEVQLDWFDPIKRPIEWFMRCRSCGALSEACATAGEAEAQWAATAPAEVAA